LELQEEQLVSLQRIQKTALLGVGIAALAVGGLLAGRLSAGAFPQRGHSEFGPRLFGRIARALDLTDDQKSQIKAILKTHASEIETQMKASAEARRAVHEAVLAQPVDEAAIRAAAQRLGEIHADGAVLFAKIRTEVQPLLTEEQRGKIQKFRERARHRADSALKSFEAILESGS
jgi:Spy/CpxP family protein refolding chaperone